eukprot:403341170
MNSIDQNVADTPNLSDQKQGFTRKLKKIKEKVKDNYHKKVDKLLGDTKNDVISKNDEELFDSYIKESIEQDEAQDLTDKYHHDIQSDQKPPLKDKLRSMQDRLKQRKQQKLNENPSSQEDINDENPQKNRSQQVFVMDGQITKPKFGTKLKGIFQDESGHFKTPKQAREQFKINKQSVDRDFKFMSYIVDQKELLIDKRDQIIAEKVRQKLLEWRAVSYYMLQKAVDGSIRFFTREQEKRHREGIRDYETERRDSLGLTVGLVARHSINEYENKKQQEKEQKKTPEIK